MKTVTGLFDDYEDATDAVGELEATGIPHSDISIVANNSSDWYDNDTSKAAEDAAGGAGLGALVGGAGGLLTGLGIMAIPGVGPVVAAGWLAATAAGAVGRCRRWRCRRWHCRCAHRFGRSGEGCPCIRRRRASRWNVGHCQSRRRAGAGGRTDPGADHLREPGRAARRIPGRRLDEL